MNLRRPAGLLPLLLCTAAACGGDEPATGPTPLTGSFVQLFGAQRTSFSLSGIDLVCRPKPGLKEFEFEAAPVLGEDSGDYFRLLIKEYSGPADYRLEYEVGKPEHRVEVGLSPSGEQKFKYKLFQHFRTDSGETLSSRCDVLLSADELPTKTHFLGQVTCAMLFADFSSADNDSSGFLNRFVDLVGRFECDY